MQWWKEVGMTHSAKSVLIFGIYIVLLGIVLVVAPNTLLGIFGLPPVKEVWIRILGVIVGILGFYYIQAGRNDLTPFFRATVYGRTVVLAAFIVFAIIGLVKPILILFGLVDFLGGVWTALALRADSKTT
jgi:hypothetical protein